LDLRLPKKGWRTDLGVMAICALGLLVYFYTRPTPFLFWDTTVYERAVADLARGANPYRIDAGLPFVYHPLVLDVFAWLNRVIPLGVALIALYVASVGWFAFELALWLRADASRSGSGAARLVDRSPWLRGCASVMAAAAFGGVGVTSTISGNLTVFMHFALIAAFLRSGRRAGWMSKNMPLALLLVFSIIKPYFLVYLLVPLVTAWRGWRDLVRVGSVVVGFALSWWAVSRIDPVAYGEFMETLKYQVLDRGDLGYSFFSILVHLMLNDRLALAIHAVVSLSLLALVTVAFAGEKPPPDRLGRVFFILYMVLTLTNPRMKEYDFFPGLVCFFIFLRATSKSAEWIILAGLCVSSIPLVVAGCTAAGLVLPGLYSAAKAWQIAGLSVATLAFAWTRVRPLGRRRACP